MSVTFSIDSRGSTEGDVFLNLSNRNACDLLSWLGLPTAELVGTISARDLAARCRRRLWPEARNVDAEVPEEVDHRFVCFGRPGGYLRQRTQELLELADLAGDGLIFWA